MRYVFLTMTLAGALCGQAIMDASAAAAGGVAGGASGKQVSDGVSGIFGKVAKQTAQAAGEVKPKTVAATQSIQPAAAAPTLEVGPGVPTSGGVPLPPVVPHKMALAKPAPPPVPEPVAIPEPLPPPPPPPEMTSDDLKKVAAGMNREDLLKLGAPGSRIAMSDDGHLQETFHYYAHGGDSMIGTVRLVDGSVSIVQVN